MFSEVFHDNRNNNVFYLSKVLNWIPVSTYYIITIVICAILYCYLHEKEAESNMIRHSTQRAADLVREY